MKFNKLQLVSLCLVGVASLTWGQDWGQAPTEIRPDAPNELSLSRSTSSYELDGQEPSTTAEPPRQQLNQQANNENNNTGNGLFGFLTSPFRRFLDQTRLFGSSAGNHVTDGMESMRMQTFRMFMQLYNKTYAPDELPRRMALFFSRRKEIEESVKSFREGRSMFVMKENEFIDWDRDELHKLTGVSLPSNPEIDEQSTERRVSRIGGPQNETLDEYDDADNLIVRAGDSVPASKDWRNSGCISTPMNQRKCGACYAVATISVVESMRCINQVSSPTLAPQQIVDCAGMRSGYGNNGCDGGWPTYVLKYLQNNNAIARETCYPFAYRQERCKISAISRKDGCTVKASPTNSNRLRYKILRSERDIMYHIANTGPVVTVMKATDKFLYYGKGIFDDPSCSRGRDDVDHAIVIVGYGRENGVDYWTIKNSWGTSTWGQDGYGKYKRGTNACSIGHRGWVITG